MADPNIKRLLTLHGLLKVFQTILGIINFVILQCQAYHLYVFIYSVGVYFLYTSFTFALMNILLVIAYFFEAEILQTTVFEMLYNLVAAILLCPGAVCYMARLYQTQEASFATFIAPICALLNSALYIGSCAGVVRAMRRR